jgi:hypothetical protein
MDGALRGFRAAVQASGGKYARTRASLKSAKLEREIEAMEFLPDQLPYSLPNLASRGLEPGDGDLERRDFAEK